MGAALSSVLEKQLVPSTQALLQPQQLIHSSQLILKLHVRARSEETRYQFPWAKENNVISDLQFHHTTHNEVAACSYFRKGNTAVCSNTPPAQLLHSLASLTLEACPNRGHAPTPHISILVQRPNHHTCSPSLRSFHNPNSLGPAGLAEHVQKYLLLHICFKDRLLSKAGLVAEFPLPK